MNLSLFDATRRCQHGQCRKPLDGAPSWEVVVTEVFGDPWGGPNNAGNEPTFDRTIIVCAGCAHHYERKRQLP
jgi:hypothetical protein